MVDMSERSVGMRHPITSNSVGIFLRAESVSGDGLGTLSISSPCSPVLASKVSAIQ
jgi:hypothetical protein